MPMDGKPVSFVTTSRRQGLSLWHLVLSSKSHSQFLFGSCGNRTVWPAVSSGQLFTNTSASSTPDNGPLPVECSTCNRVFLCIGHLSRARPRRRARTVRRRHRSRQCGGRGRAVAQWPEPSAAQEPIVATGRDTVRDKPALQLGRDDHDREVHQDDQCHDLYPVRAAAEAVERGRGSAAHLASQVPEGLLVVHRTGGRSADTVAGEGPGCGRCPGR